MAPETGPSTPGDFRSALATVTVELRGALWADAGVTRRPGAEVLDPSEQGVAEGVFRVEPPPAAPEAVGRFVVSIAVVTPFAIPVRLLFEAFGWSEKYGTAVGLGLAISIVGWHLDRRGGPPHRGRNDGS